MKKIVVLLLLCLVSIVLIFVLHTVCIKQNINIGKFDRNFANVNLNKVGEIVLPFECTDIIEINDEFIALKGVGLNRIFKINLNTKKSLIIDLKHKDHNSNFVNDTLYSFDPYLKMGFRYNKDLEKIDSINFRFPFDRAVAIGNDKILFRSSNKNFTKGIFKGYDLKKLKDIELSIRLNDSLVIDGGLTSDGFFVHENSKLVYIQYHKGYFYKIGVDFKSITGFSTVDKIHKVDGLKISKDSAFYFSKPVLSINLFSAINKNELYIVSFAKGNTDVLSKFMKYRTIDVYGVINGKYLYSFYLPNDGDEKAHGVKINNNKLCLLFNNKVIIYEL
jgi:hypothetical protein